MKFVVLNNNPTAATPDVGKPKSGFQKLWDEAEQLKRHNVELETSLDALVIRIQNELGPKEMALGRTMRVQIDKLIIFAGRKSLSQWQIQMLYEWIESTMEYLHTMGLVDDELRNNLAQMQAADFGIEIDPHSDLSAVEQFAHGIENQFNNIDALIDDDAGNDDEDDFAQWFEEKLAEIDLEEDLHERDEADSNAWANHASDTRQTDTEQPKKVFKTLFHRVARALHPDKEVDPKKREAKQALMTQLLEARRQHDLMRVFQLYSEHVDGAIEFAEQDLAELCSMLSQYIERESERIFDIASKSYLHGVAYAEFYNKDPKKVDKALTRKIKEIEKRTADIEIFSKNVTSLVKLKPYLEDRYDQLHSYF